MGIELSQEQHTVLKETRAVATPAEFHALRGKECGKERNRKGARGARNQRPDDISLSLALLAPLRSLCRFC
ncbi:uncharacterized protein SOCE836_007310 [Sorangium cellulosum]|uniref:Uncharacterized protein n=1 Tax=Sorangium cellulosum TaxID=56 RepID=A0A4P2QFK9_SORCE|nr:uncharacterized protein SOCE836_007310 [Sorangium cellulosum]WCQ88047.1 hypothetical protein NQZ70_00718 [Sorangium sp. Soce836]